MLSAYVVVTSTAFAEFSLHPPHEKTSKAFTGVERIFNAVLSPRVCAMSSWKCQEARKIYDVILF